MASWFCFTCKRPERKKKVPKMPSTTIILYAPHTADKMVKEYVKYFSRKQKRSKN
jgi:hypothetical protein